MRVDGKVRELEDDDIRLEKNKKHTIEVVIDRLIVRAGVEKRLTSVRSR